MSTLEHVKWSRKSRPEGPAFFIMTWFTSSILGHPVSSVHYWPSPEQTLPFRLHVSPGLQWVQTSAYFMKSDKALRIQFAKWKARVLISCVTSHLPPLSEEYKWTFGFSINKSMCQAGLCRLQKNVPLIQILKTGLWVTVLKKQHQQELSYQISLKL